MMSRFVLWFSLAYFASTAVSSTQAVECQGTAKYTLTFKAEWTPVSHADFPSSAHFSSLVGCSHNASYVMWTPGGKATTGVKSVAETGSTSALWTEMQVQEQNKNVYKRYRGGGISGGTGTVSISNIEVDREYPLVSFITMIAPSPDWFVGVHDWQLCDTTTGKWKDSSARDLPPYDSGTDSGPDFTSANNATIPPVDIHLITNEIEGSLKSDKPILRFGVFTFEKTFDSNPAPVTTAPSGNKPTPSVTTATSGNKPTSSVTTATSGNGPTPTGTAAHPAANFSTSLVLTLCILNILKNIL